MWIPGILPPHTRDFDREWADAPRGIVWDWAAYYQEAEHGAVRYHLRCWAEAPEAYDFLVWKEGVRAWRATHPIVQTPLSVLIDRCVARECK